MLINESPKLKNNYNICIDPYWPKEVSNFYYKLNREAPYMNNNYFNRNSETLIIDKKIDSKTEQIKRKIYDFLDLGTAEAFYFPNKNKITFYDQDTFSDYIYHELLHCFSSFYNYDTKECYTGFFQSYFKNGKFISFGRTLNEGYTSVLDNRYFHQSKVMDGYNNQRQIALAVEKIIGQETMERFYSEANLYGLVENLTLYNRKEKIVAFINYTDLLTNYFMLPKHTKKVLGDTNKFIEECQKSSYYKIKK